MKSLGAKTTDMAKFVIFINVLAAAIMPVFVDGIKIAFVGDTGMEGMSTEPALFSHEVISYI